MYLCRHRARREQICSNHLNLHSERLLFIFLTFFFIFKVQIKYNIQTKEYISYWSWIHLSEQNLGQNHCVLCNFSFFPNMSYPFLFICTRPKTHVQDLVSFSTVLMDQKLPWLNQQNLVCLAKINSAVKVKQSGFGAGCIWPLGHVELTTPASQLKACGYGRGLHGLASRLLCL